MLNKEQVKQMFSCEAVILGNHDGVPVSRAAELFGKRAAEFATGLKQNGRITYTGSFGVGDFDCDYLTLDGFLMAATFANVQSIREREMKTGDVLNHGQAN